MTGTATAGTDAAPRPRARRGRRRVVWALLAVGVVVAILAIGPRRGFGPPLDPDSTGPDGVRGLVDVLLELGADVDVRSGAPGPDDVRALVITDRLTDGQRAALLEWVSDGGTLVNADPLSELAPQLGGLTSIAFTEPTIEPACDDPAVAGVGRVAVADGVVFALDEDDQDEASVGAASGCFPRNGGQWLVRQPRGDGHVVNLGGAFSLTNDLLDDADNAILLVNLLLPPDGGGVHVLRGDDPEAGGTETLGEVLPDQVGVALWSIPLAWLALVWWRGRRHGRPVDEQPPVRVDAAETVVAVGNLLQRAGRAADAAATLRGRLAADLRARLGLPRTVTGDALVAVAADRTGVDADRIRAVLVAPPPRTDDDLIAFARAVADVRGALLNAGTDRPPTDDALPEPPRVPTTRSDPQ